MAKYNVRRFANPEVLRSIRPDNLINLLGPFTDYLRGRGVRIQRATLRAVNDDLGSEDTDVVDFDKLAGVLLNPDESFPEALINALYLISESATDAAMHGLLARARIEPRQDLSPADVATQVYLSNPELLERVHSEQFVGARKSFRYYLSREAPTQKLAPSDSAIVELERDLAAWFESKKKGNHVRVFVYGKDTEAWFLIRHGEGFRRDSAQKSGKSTSVFYRPEKYDVAVYTHSTGELRINAEEREREVYRAAFGRRLFGADDFFPVKTLKYTLEPLRDGPHAIGWNDIEGIDEVILEEVKQYLGGAHHQKETHSADNLYAALGPKRLGTALIISARFKIRFSDSKTPRTVIITPPTNAKFTRDSDGARVAAWLFARGIDLSRPPA